MTWSSLQQRSFLVAVSFDAQCRVSFEEMTSAISKLKIGKDDVAYWLKL